MELDGFNDPAMSLVLFSLPNESQKEIGTGYEAIAHTVPSSAPSYKWHVEHTSMNTSLPGKSASTFLCCSVDGPGATGGLGLGGTSETV